MEVTAVLEAIWTTEILLVRVLGRAHLIFTFRNEIGLPKMVRVAANRRSERFLNLDVGPGQAVDVELPGQACLSLSDQPVHELSNKSNDPTIGIDPRQNRLGDAFVAI